MSEIAIQSLGRPPEKHADGIIAELMQQLAVKHAHLSPSTPTSTICR
jgi:hypothetical protein